MRRKGEGTIHHTGYILIKKNGVKKGEHQWIAEKILGRELRGDEQVHHVNEDRADNANNNLVICQSTAYHALLHIRQKALEVSSHAGWIKCVRCHQYDDPNNLYISKNNWAAHRKCEAEYNVRRNRLVNKHG